MGPRCSLLSQLNHENYNPGEKYVVQILIQSNFHIPVVQHKAVAEVSIIENL